MTKPDCYELSLSPLGWCYNRARKECPMADRLDECPYALGKDNPFFEIVKTKSGTPYPYKIVRREEFKPDTVSP